MQWSKMTAEEQGHTMEHATPWYYAPISFQPYLRDSLRGTNRTYFYCTCEDCIPCGDYMDDNLSVEDRVKYIKHASLPVIRYATFNGKTAFAKICDGGPLEELVALTRRYKNDSLQIEILGKCFSRLDRDQAIPAIVEVIPADSVHWEERQWKWRCHNNNPSCILWKSFLSYSVDLFRVIITAIDTKVLQQLLRDCCIIPCILTAKSVSYETRELFYQEIETRFHDLNPSKGIICCVDNPSHPGTSVWDMCDTDEEAQFVMDVLSPRLIEHWLLSFLKRNTTVGGSQLHMIAEYFEYVEDEYFADTICNLHSPLQQWVRMIYDARLSMGTLDLLKARLDDDRLWNEFCSRMKIPNGVAMVVGLDYIVKYLPDEAKVIHLLCIRYDVDSTVDYHHANSDLLVEHIDPTVLVEKKMLHHMCGKLYVNGVRSVLNRIPRANWTDENERGRSPIQYSENVCQSHNWYHREERLEAIRSMLLAASVKNANDDAVMSEAEALETHEGACRLVLIGDGNVGKTSLLLHYDKEE